MQPFFTRNAICRLLMPCFFIFGIATTAKTQALFKETFDGINGTTAGGPGTYAFPAGWLLANVDNLTPNAQVNYVNQAWTRREDFGLNVGDSCAFSTSYYSPVGQADDWMWTPAIAIIGPGVELKWRARAYDPSYPDGYEVRIMTTPPTGSTGVMGNMLSSTIVFNTAAEAASWTTHTINLSSYIGQTVYIGFRNHSTDQFLLVIDDVAVNVVNNHDAAVTKIKSYEYTQTPLAQLKTAGVPLSGYILNAGNQAITGVQLDARVYNSSNVLVFNETSLSTTLASGAVDSFTITTNWHPTVADTYTIQYFPSLIEPDERTSNDTMTTTFVVTDTVYARDNGNVVAQLGIGTGNGGYLGQSFTNNKTSLLTSLSVAYTRGYTGARYALAVWSTDGTGKPDAIIATTDTLLYTSDSFLVKTIPLRSGGVVLQPGTYTLTAIEFDSTLALAQCSSVFTPNTEWVYFNGEWNPVEHFGINFTKAFYLRANFVTCIPGNRLYVDAAKKNNPTGDGTTWGKALGSLDKALMLASVCDNVTEIWVKAGTYIPSTYPTGSTGGTSGRDYAFALQSGLAIYGGFAGTETLLSQRNVAANQTNLSGDRGVSGARADNCYHVVVSVNNDTTAVLDGFTIRSANANSVGALSMGGYSINGNQGGGIYIGNSAPVIRNCTISNSFADDGAGIIVANTSAGSNPDITISNNRFFNNAAVNGGGAISVPVNCNITLANNYFERNSASYGGALRIDGLGIHITAKSNIFNGNTSSSGGGGAMSLNTGFENDIVNNIFIANKDLSTTGGGAINTNDGTNVVVNNTFYGDTTAGKGGAIKIQGFSTLQLFNNVFNKCKGKPDNDVAVATSVSYYKGTNLFGTAILQFSNTYRPAGPDSIWATADDGLHLAPGSAGINDGDNTKVPAGITTDITGAPRIKGTKVDIGAYEGAGPAALSGFIGGDTVICKNSYSPVQFTGRNGVLPYTFVYTVTNGADDTVTTAAGDSSVMLNKLLTTAGIFTYRLKSITDGTGNTILPGEQRTVTVRQLPTITITPADGSDSICYGSLKQVTLKGTGTPGPYSYRIDSLGFDGAANFNVPAGTHMAYVQDSKGCIKADNFIIEQPAQMLQATAIQTNPTTVQITATGGFGPAYKYSINSGTYRTSGAITIAETAGVDTANVRDRKGCQASTTITLLSATPNIVSDSVCFGAKRTISITAQGGKAPLNYSLNGGSFVSANSFLVAAGTYTITVKDANGVTITVPPITISQPPTKLVVSTVINTSGVTVTASGGFGNYLYAFDSAGVPQTSGHFNWSGVTNDTVFAKDISGCTIPVYLKGLFATLIAVDHTNTVCFGELKTITAQAVGGIPPLKYSLNGSTLSATDTFAVVPGTYAVRVKDAKNNIFKTDSITIIGPSSPVTINVTVTNVSCHGAANGIITATATGGLGSYTYSINGGAFTASNVFDHLSPGSYKVAVKDYAGCRVVKTVSVTQPATICGKVTQQVDVRAKAATLDVLAVKVYPNPTQADFNLKVISGDSKKIVELRVMDMLGRTIYHTRGSVYSTYTFGKTFASGMYMAEVMNGTNVQRVKLVKGN